MLDPLSNQTDKPQPLLSQEQTKPANVPPASQPYIVQGANQPYIIQLANQPYSIQQPSQPYIIQVPSQPNIIQQPPQSYVIKAPTQVVQTANQPLVFQNGLQFINTDSENLKKKLCCIRIWTIIMFVPSIFDIYLTLDYNEPPVSGVVGIISLGIVSYFIYRSVKDCDVGKYKIALHIYFVFFVAACMFYIYAFFILRLSNYRYERLTPMYLIETGLETITIYFLFSFKKEFDGVSKKENLMPVSPLTA